MVHHRRVDHHTSDEVELARHNSDLYCLGNWELYLDNVGVHFVPADVD